MPNLHLAADLPAPPRELYSMYLSPKWHAAFTGTRVTVSARAGARFEAFQGAIWGRILQLVPGQLIVQSWRSKNFGQKDIDSTLVLHFCPRPQGGRIELSQVNVADRDFGGVCAGWAKYYFDPWRRWLENGRPARRPPA